MENTDDWQQCTVGARLIGHVPGKNISMTLEAVSVVLGQIWRSQDLEFTLMYQRRYFGNDKVHVQGRTAVGHSHFVM